MESIIKNDLSMSYTLVKLINSAYFGLNSRVESIQQALTLLGIKKVKKWIILYLMCEFCSDKPDILFKTALIRASFAEYISSLLKFKNYKFNYYIMGLLSGIDAFFDIPLRRILNEFDNNNNKVYNI